MKEFKQYLELLAFLSVGFGLFWIFNYDRSYQIYITIVMGIGYVIWGAIHHLSKKEFYWHILFEYIAVSLVACTIVIYLLSRA